MSYNRENYIKVKRSYEGKYLKARDAAAARFDELSELYPEIKRLRTALADGAAGLYKVIGGGDEAAAEVLLAENQSLNAALRAAITAAGYPEDYIDVKYECPLCNDSGYDDNGRICACMKRRLAIAGLESSGLGRLYQTQSFENFDIKYYSPEDRPKMKRALANCELYAEHFDPTNRGLLFIGPPGTGKTHLTTSIARVVIESGYDVVYSSAPKILREFEIERFRRDGQEQSDTRRFFDCELLIIDDLGTEVENSFTVSTVYDLLNTRINEGLATLVSTNLSDAELKNRYSERVRSRLFGEFDTVRTYGGDVRMKILKE